MKRNPSKIQRNIVNNSMIAYISEHGAEINYIAGTITNVVHEVSGHKLMSASVSLGVVLAWNYLDGCEAVALGVRQLFNETNYRQREMKVRGILNIISGFQLFALSYNPALTGVIGLAGGAAALAAPSFALAMFCDLVNASMDYYNAWKENTIEGWLTEKVQEFNYRTSFLEEDEERAISNQLHDDIFSRARVYLDGFKAEHDGAEYKKIVALFNTLKKQNNNNTDNEVYTENELKNQLALQVSENDKLRDSNVKLALNQTFNQANSNLQIKTMSFIGMTLLAIVPFVATGPVSIPLIIGITLIVIVALSYMKSNAIAANQYMLSANTSPTLFAVSSGKDNTLEGGAPKTLPS